MTSPTLALSTKPTGAYALVTFSKLSWNRVRFISSSGFPKRGSTIKSLVFLKLAFDGDITSSIGRIISTCSPYRAPNSILNDSSVPLVE